MKTEDQIQTRINELQEMYLIYANKYVQEELMMLINMFKWVLE